ncbi:MAG: nucleoside monophosphate kinase [Candidatus ainarchaeum sp.]|nr:nucleoside monophosphate kinase [Candidatus ainarchaeum sp.]MDD3975913.1 nucleoside monophosphate kinase [Candidatus ainarchaeum sp.]
MKNLYIILGPQGSGKSTQGENIKNKFNLGYIIMSDLLIKKSKQNKNIKKIMTNGELVPPEISSDLMFKEIKKIKNKNILIDGFPREIAQANMLDYFLYLNKDIKLKNIIYIKLNKKECIKRLLLRKRYDDTKKSIENRLNFYYEKTDPVIKEYKNRNKLIIINGNKEIKEVFKEITTKIKNKIK